MLTRVAKEFDFHAAHVLPHHDGQCRRLHGHTYKLRVIVEGEPQPVNTMPDEGMVVDFSVLKGIYKEHVEPFVEHQLLNETIVKPGYCLVTTCELMVEWIARKFIEAWDVPGVRIAVVRLWETPTSWAEVIL